LRSIQVFKGVKKDLKVGKLENWRRSGLCRKTKSFFCKDEVIIVSLPPSKYKKNNRKAKIF